MNKNSRKRIYRKAVRKWGLDLQLDVLIEECGELIQAVVKHKRGAHDCSNNLAEEMADVEIMIEQIKTQLNWENLEIKVDAIREIKLERFKKIVDAD